MSRRAPHPTPPALWGMKYVITDGLYCFTSDAGITYRMTFEMMVSLKQTFKSYDTVEEWYASLSRADRITIIREGNVPPTTGTGFYPDPIPDDF